MVPLLSDLPTLCGVYIHRSLQDLLDYDGDDVEDVYCLTFTVNVNVLDQVVTKELIPNGSHKPVTHENR